MRVFLSFAWAALFVVLAVPAMAQIGGGGIQTVTDGTNTSSKPTQLDFTSGCTVTPVFGVAQVACSGGGGGGTPANPTATAGPTAINGSATTYMRSDAAPAVQTASNAQLGLAQGDGQTVCVTSGIAATCVANNTFTAGHTIAATDMGGQVNMNGTNLTVTIPAVSSTIFYPGATAIITNVNATDLTISSTPTINGFSGTKIPQNGGISCTGNGATLDCFGLGVLKSYPNSNVSPTPATAGTSVTLVAPRGYYFCTGACTVTLPVPALGYEFCVKNDDNIATVITLAAISGVQFENTAQTSYKTANTAIASSGAIGDSICYIGRDASHYNIGSFKGTWN